MELRCSQAGGICGEMEVSIVEEGFPLLPLGKCKPKVSERFRPPKDWRWNFSGPLVLQVCMIWLLVWFSVLFVSITLTKCNAYMQVHEARAHRQTCSCGLGSSGSCWAQTVYPNAYWWTLDRRPTQSISQWCVAHRWLVPRVPTELRSWGGETPRPCPGTICRRSGSYGHWLKRRRRRGGNSAWTCSEAKSSTSREGSFSRRFRCGSPTCRSSNSSGTSFGFDSHFATHGF